MEQKSSRKKWQLEAGLLTFASVLAAMPATLSANNVLPPFEAVQAVGYPSESLAQRIERIKRVYHVNVNYDSRRASAVRVPALRRASAGVDLSRSVSSTGFSVRSNGSRDFSLRYNGRSAASSHAVVTRATNVSAVQQQARQGGTLKGSVMDKSGSPIAGATIRIAGTKLGAITDLKGEFVLRNVPARSVTVEVSCISFATMRVSDVNIRSGQTKPLDVILQDADTKLGEVVVTATYNNANANALYARQKNMVAISDGISADLMKKTSDNNMAQVLGRVSGVTIENGKYVTVRGMGERYNNVELNGASLPSSEPNRRNFSFDVIPSALVDNVTIAKTFTPDLPGEFTGGLIEVQTLAVPDKRFVNLNVGTGMNTISTGKDFMSNTRYKADWLFGNIGSRQWYAGQDAEATKQSMKNAGEKNSYGLRRFTAMPLQNYSVIAGLPFHFGNNQKIGIVAALTYRNEQTREEIKEGHFITGDSLIHAGNRYRMVTTTGAIANIGWQMPGHKITWRNLFNNRFSHTNMERALHKYYEDYNFVDQYSAPLQSRVTQTQLEGEHDLFDDKLLVTWNASYNKVQRTSPDDRYVVGRINRTTADGRELLGWNLTTDVQTTKSLGDGYIMYSQLDENKKNAALNVAYPFIVKGNKQQIKAGYMGTFRRADYQQIYLKATSGNVASKYGGQNITDYFSPAHFADGSFSYISAMDLPEADFYTGKQDIHATYLMGEFTFFKKLHLTTGVRMEKGMTETHTKFFDGTEYSDSTVNVRKTDWLPAATVVYNILDNLNARFAYSKTLARPDFRELTTSTYYNVDDRVTVKTFKPIEQTYIDNYDLRLEWYPNPGEVISISGFYKKFKHPVELITWSLSPQDIDLYNYNLESSVVKGIEFNIRKSLGFIAPESFLKDMYFNANASFIKGDVKYKLDDLLGADLGYETRKRPLQGLAPYTINAGLTYQGKILGAALNYARSGRKLVMAGGYEKYDQYEAPRDVLDLQLSAKFLHERLEVKVNASDLLNQDIIVYRNCGYENAPKDPGNDRSYADLTDDMGYNPGDWVISRIKKGINLSLSIGYKF